MGKLKLNLEDLRVRSFETTPSSAWPEGTVEGQTTRFEGCGSGTECSGTPDCMPHGEYTNWWDCYTESEQGCPTQVDPTCEANCTAYNTCWCANESRPGWESCGTTCMEPSCQVQGTCDPM